MHVTLPCPSAHPCLSGAIATFPVLSFLKAEEREAQLSEFERKMRAQAEEQVAYLRGVGPAALSRSPERLGRLSIDLSYSPAPAAIAALRALPDTSAASLAGPVCEPKPRADIDSQDHQAAGDTTATATVAEGAVSAAKAGKFAKRWGRFRARRSSLGQVVEDCPATSAPDGHHGTNDLDAASLDRLDAASPSGDIERAAHAGPDEEEAAAALLVGLLAVVVNLL